VSDQATFSARVLAYTDNAIARMNALNPRPQGILIWNLEGEEFAQYFTYVGNPNKLHDMAPEMDAVADQMFAKVRAAGYIPGITLRPSNFQTGSALPATCHHESMQELSDVFVNTSVPYPNRGFACTATNTWTQPGANLPYWQMMSNDDTVLYTTLRDKVAYA